MERIIFARPDIETFTSFEILIQIILDLQDT